MIPVLTKPSYWSLRNRWRQGHLGADTRLRDFMIVLIAALVMLAIYVGTSRVIGELKTFSELIYLPAAHPIALVLMLLWIMLFISNLVAAFAHLLLGSDLDLLLSSPFSTNRFFFGKLWHIVLSSSWMPIIFVGPFLCAFGVQYSAPSSFYLSAPVLLIPYFLIPAAASMAVVLLIARVIPAGRTRELLIICGILAIGIAAYLLQMAGRTLQPSDNISELVRIVSILSMPSASWIPSNWVAQCLQEILEPTPQGTFAQLILLFSMASGISALSYLVFVALHARTYSRHHTTSLRRSSGPTLTIPNGIPSFGQVLGKATSRLAGSTFFALVWKEFRTLSRDVTQILQIGMLLSLAIVYLFNVKVFSATSALPGISKVNWQSFLYIMNCAIGAFFTTAVCTRFVFPSISLEGKAYWILDKAPLHFRTLVLSKFVYWLGPTVLFALVIFAAGTLTIEPMPKLIAINSAAAILMGITSTALALGFGAWFSNFNWEHASQLQASFGSLVYMLFSVIVILLSLVPTGVLVYFTNPAWHRDLLTPQEQLYWQVSAVLFLIVINVSITLWALRLALLALEEKRA